MTAERIVVVPWAPQPLIVPGKGEPRPDGVDQFVDDLLGDVGQKPAWPDVALLAGGAGLVVGAVAGGNSPALVFTGAMAGLLGCVPLARTAWRALGRRRPRPRPGTAMTLGLPLVASHPDTEALIGAYGRLLELAALPGATKLGEEAAVAAHLAVVEAATILDGEPPSLLAEKKFVRQRTAAIEALSLTLQRHHQARVAAGG
jgi:hypothetical protein